MGYWSSRRRYRRAVDSLDADSLEKRKQDDRKIKWSVINFVVAIIILLGSVTYYVVREGGIAREIQRGLIENCETSPVRQALTEILTEEIAESHGPLLPKVAEALGISLQEAEHITDKSDNKKEGRLSQIEPSDCEAQYK